MKPLNLYYDLPCHTVLTVVNYCLEIKVLTKKKTYTLLLNLTGAQMHLLKEPHIIYKQYYEKQAAIACII